MEGRDEGGMKHTRPNTKKEREGRITDGRTDGTKHRRFTNKD